MFTLPNLTYSYDAYEPYIDKETMHIHHQKHHGGYVKKLNQALSDNDINVEQIEQLFETISQYPDAIRNNAGGHYNHSLFWSVLSPEPSVPEGDINQALEKRFGSIDSFQEEFNKVAGSVFGSGWAWLVIDHQKELQIVSTPNQDNPLMNDYLQGYPLLAIDVWEHAYYLHYQNKRGEYLEAFWALVNWKEVNRRFIEQPIMGK